MRWVTCRGSRRNAITPATFFPSLACVTSLVATGGVARVIIEHTANDSYWGDGGVRDWCESMPGNELGKLLMRIRGELIARGTVSQFPLPNLTG